MNKLNECLKQIIGNEISWFDYRKLSIQQWSNYYSDAQMIVSNETFNNELEHYKAELIKECAIMEGIPADEMKLIKLTNLQAMVIALEMFKERLKEIESPKDERMVEEPHSAI